jgi:hypothetical protein
VINKWGKKTPILLGLDGCVCGNILAVNESMKHIADQTYYISSYIYELFK